MNIKYSNLYKASILWLFFMGLTACSSSPVRFYQGPQLPASDVARITTDFTVADDLKLFGNKGLARLVEIDGKLSSSSYGYHAAWDGSLDVELMPGNHTLGVKYIGRQDGKAVKSVDMQRFSFNAKKGHVYVLSARVTGMRWQAVLTDATTNKQVYPK